METLLVIEIVLLALALVGVFALLNVVRGLRANVRGLEGRVESLQRELTEQKANLDAVRAVLERKPDDPFEAVLDTVDRFRSRGMVATVAFVGVRLFRSYLGRRARRKALPLLDKSAE